MRLLLQLEPAAARPSDLVEVIGILLVGPCGVFHKFSIIGLKRINLGPRNDF